MDSLAQTLAFGCFRPKDQGDSVLGFRAFDCTQAHRVTRVGGGLRNSLSRASLGIPPGCSGPFPVGSGKPLRMDPGCTRAVITPELISGLLKSLLLSSAAE